MTPGISLGNKNKEKRVLDRLEVRYDTDFYQLNPAD